MSLTRKNDQTLIRIHFHVASSLFLCTIVAQRTRQNNRITLDQRRVNTLKFNFATNIRICFPDTEESDCGWLVSERHSFVADLDNYWVFRKNCVLLNVWTKLVYVAFKRHVLATRGNGVLKHTILCLGEHAVWGGWNVLVVLPSFLVTNTSATKL